MKFAVIGGGISGLTAAFVLSQRYEVTLYEAGDRIGGHTHTVEVATDDGASAVDMGFIVFNEENYPNFLRLIATLGVASQPSDMSFSVSCQQTGLEYRASTLSSFFAQRRNLLKPSFHRMIVDIARFNRHSKKLLDTVGADDPTLEEYVRRGRYSKEFLEQFLIPMGSSIWSSDPDQMRSFPASSLVRFFHNHGFLSLYGAPRWRTVQGGSSAYLRPISRPFAERIRLQSPVRAVTRLPDRVEVRTDELTESFDHVVIAAHSNQALAMLTDPSREEREILSAIPYQPNETVLHTDTRLLPSNRRAWASWNCTIPRRRQRRVNVTYHSNQLQALGSPPDYCVTLNRSDEIRPDKVVETAWFEHPVYSFAGLEAQSRFAEVSGRNRTSFCGAYWGYGFHEDGVTSALNATKPFGVSI